MGRGAGEFVKGLLIFNIQRHIYNGYTIKIGRLPSGLGIYGPTRTYRGYGTEWYGWAVWGGTVEITATVNAML